MANIKDLILDQKKEQEGVWVPYDLDVELLIESTGSADFRKACSELLRPYRQKIRTGELDFEERVKIIGPAIAEHLLKGWKNLNDNGKPITFSVKKALEIFDILLDMRMFILASADEKEWFRREYQKESAKNLPTASHGT